MYSAPDLIIDNAPRRGRGKSGVPIINPATEEALGTISFANGEDVADAIVSAQKGFEAWRKVSSWERSNTLLRIAGLIRERKAEIARLISLEVGKPLLEAELETQSGVEHFEWAAAAARQLHGNSINVRAPDGRGQATYEPVGIALALTAWNFPINLSTRKVCMALAAGCACILRPSSEAPASVAAMVQCCIDAGLPEGAITLLFGTPKGASGIATAQVFTPSTPTCSSSENRLAFLSDRVNTYPAKPASCEFAAFRASSTLENEIIGARGAKGSSVSMFDEGSRSVITVGSK